MTKNAALGILAPLIQLGGVLVIIKQDLMGYKDRMN